MGKRRWGGEWGRWGLGGWGVGGFLSLSFLFVFKGVLGKEGEKKKKKSQEGRSKK